MEMSVIMTLVAGLAGSIAGSVVTLIANYFKNKIQVMECQFLEDDVLSKIPQKGINNEIHENLHCKKFKVKNTTNSDVKEFQILFQFDNGSIVTDCYSKSKEGYNMQRIKKDKNESNQAVAYVKEFNRDDEIEYSITVANVSNNQYYITEAKCIGFKIRCKDKREKSERKRPAQSNQVLVTKH